MEEAIIEFKNVTKSFGEQFVLKNVSCKIAKGKTTVILGPSGTGKSVFSKLSIGLLKPDSGIILVNGQDIVKMKRKDLFETRKKFGMLFQDGALFDSLSVGENIAFPLYQHTKKTNSEIKEIVKRKLNQVGLPNIENKLPSELSGGMRKRVGFARAIALDPDIVIFDEPNSGLDPIMSNAIDELILKMKKELGSTFIVISHDIIGTFNIADYIGMLYNGDFIIFGTKEDVLNSENEIVRDFLKRNLKEIV